MWKSVYYQKVEIFNYIKLKNINYLSLVDCGEIVDFLPLKNPRAFLIYNIRAHKINMMIFFYN